MEAFKEKTVGFLLVIGSLITIVSIIAVLTFAGGGIMRGTYTRTPITNEITDPGTLNWVPLAYFFLTCGVGILVGCLVYGLWTHHTRHDGVRETYSKVRVLARYGFTKNWVMITAEWELEQADNPHHFVRLEFGPNDVRELECSEQVYFQCGEGMFGDVELQGKWLGKFTPYVGVPGR
jgi:hypothetical protein